MFKISCWGKRSDPLERTIRYRPRCFSFLICIFVLTGYGRDDGCTPVDVKVTDLDGHEVDMSKGSLYAASQGTR